MAACESRRNAPRFHTLRRVRLDEHSHFGRNVVSNLHLIGEGRTLLIWSEQDPHPHVPFSFISCMVNSYHHGTVVRYFLMRPSPAGPFDAALKLMADGLDLTPLTTKQIPFANVADALALAGTKGSVKVQLLMPTPAL